MKLTLCLAVLALAACFCSLLFAQTSESKPAPGKLRSAVYDWEKLTATPTLSGLRRPVFEGPTTTVDQLHCHITTLNPGAASGEPHRHLQEEVIVIKEGKVEATVDGRTEIAGAGSVIFFAANAVSRLRNIGDGPATYTVIYYITPLTPKQ
jgi:quercetin dioxygenase-like cupin family protein